LKVGSGGVGSNLFARAASGTCVDGAQCAILGRSTAGAFLMSSPPQVRRTDKLMADSRAREMLERGFCGRLATVGVDGFPYAVPLLYVMLDGELYLHNTQARGHLRANVEHDPRICFEIDEPGEVFAYGRFECDSSVAYRSVILFGRIRVVEDLPTKQRFCEALMAKYGKDSERPKNFFPRIDLITVYAVTIERITGKETPLPAISEQWPALDRTKSPNTSFRGAGVSPRTRNP
jgi:uncharacterized protein